VKSRKRANKPLQLTAGLHRFLGVWWVLVCRTLFGKLPAATELLLLAANNFKFLSVKGIRYMKNKTLGIVPILCSISINIVSTQCFGQIKSQMKKYPIESQTTTATNQYKVVDTGQKKFFNNSKPISKPDEGQPFYGQDAQYITNEPSYTDNGDGTISDLATGLIWQQSDSKKAMSWEDALAWAQQKNKENYLGYSDWRLPNAKELQSIVDYSRSPQATNSAAISPFFEVSQIKDEGGKTNYPFYWSSTTHKNLSGGNAAVYVCFGEALGFLKPLSHKVSDRKAM